MSADSQTTETMNHMAEARDQLSTKLHIAREGERKLAGQALTLVDRLSRDFNAELPHPSMEAFNALVHTLNGYELGGEIPPEPMRPRRFGINLTLLIVGGIVGAGLALWQA